MWYYETGKDGIAISTRVRFARNLKEFKFPNIMTDQDADNLIKCMGNVVDNNVNLLRLKDIDKITLNSLVERHLVSKEFVKKVDKKAVLLNEDCTLSVMINEEDHLRIQGFSSGNDIKTAYEKAKNVEEKIGKKLEYAIHDKFGYLTACPTNIGSGMRVSVMLHLPALTQLGYISKLLQEAGAFGIAIRGLYGENTAAEGNIYQISNQRTMGLMDEEIISNVDRIVKNIIKQEKKARMIIMENKIYFEDKVMRSFGILKYARRIDTREAEKHISVLRIGVLAGIIQGVDKDTIQRISVNIYPNMLKLEYKKDLEDEQRDIKRAEYIRRELN